MIVDIRVPDTIEIMIRETLNKINNLNLASVRYGSKVHNQNSLCTCSECNRDIREDSNYCWYCGCSFASLGSTYSNSFDYQIIKEFEKFTGRTYNPDEIYLFNFILCDNQVDNDNECFSVSALNQIKEKFLGKSGIFDHMYVKDVMARIFKTELVVYGDRQTSYGTTLVYVKAWAYIVRTSTTEPLIKEIGYHIKDKASISCSCLKKVCNKCGINVLRNPCSCKNSIKSIDEIQDVYEWSFVVPPRLNETIVTKSNKEDDLK